MDQSSGKEKADLPMLPEIQALCRNGGRRANRCLQCFDQSQGRPVKWKIAKPSEFASVDQVFERWKSAIDTTRITAFFSVGSSQTNVTR
jgi:hypothetical protein